MLPQCCCARLQLLFLQGRAPLAAVLFGAAAATPRAARGLGREGGSAFEGLSSAVCVFDIADSVLVDRWRCRR